MFFKALRRRPPKPKPKMSKPLFSSDERKELKRALAAGEISPEPKGKVSVFQFGGKTLRSKWVSHNKHEDMLVHVKGIKLVWNELRKIWSRRRWNPLSKPLYEARFFDLAAVDQDGIIYEYVDAPTMDEYLKTEKNKQERAKVLKAYRQLKADCRKAIERAKKKRAKVEARRESEGRDAGKVLPFRPDLKRDNVLFEGLDEQGRPKFVLMDIIHQMDLDWDIDT